LTNKILINDGAGFSSHSTPCCLLLAQGNVTLADQPLDLGMPGGIADKFPFLPDEIRTEKGPARPVRLHDLITVHYTSFCGYFFA
jgi:hypothetical protein